MCGLARPARTSSAHWKCRLPCDANRREPKPHHANRLPARCDAPRPNRPGHRATMHARAASIPAGSLPLFWNSSKVMTIPWHFLVESGCLFSEDVADDILDGRTRPPSDPPREPGRARSGRPPRRWLEELQFGRESGVLSRIEPREPKSAPVGAENFASTILLPGELLNDPIEQAVKHDAPMVDEDHPLAKLLDVLHVVAGQQDRCAALRRCGA